MLVSVFYLVPHQSHSCLVKRVLSWSSDMEMAPAQLQEAGQVPSSLSSTQSSFPVTLVPQHECTDGIKDKTFPCTSVLPSCSTAEDPSLVPMVQEQCWGKERCLNKTKTVAQPQSSK